jgi:predicted chitinase
VLKKTQEILKKAKLYTGIIDGQIGIATLRAIDSMDKPTAMEVQTLLKSGKVYSGNIDGVFGPASYAAFNSLIPAPVITNVALQKIYPKASSKFLQYINANATKWGIQTKAEMCLFLANVLVESGGFNDKDLRENFNYSPERLVKTFGKYITNIESAKTLIAKGQEAIAERVYGGRLGNVNIGDGWKFRGGGLIQTTGRYNYSLVSKAIGVDLVNFTYRIAEPEVAVLSALYYWKSKNCGSLANQMKVSQCRKAINGGSNGLDEVNDYFLKAWSYLF